jgi:hypothetical protein
MKDCPQQHFIVDYVFRELDEKDRRKFKAHLQTCEVCQLQLQQFEKTFSVIKKAKTEKPPKELMNNYLRVLQNSFYPKRSLLQKVNEWIDDFVTHPSLSMRLAQATIMLLIGVLLGRLLFFQPQTPITNLADNNIQSAAAISDQLLRHYLQETEMILLDVANTNPAEDARILESIKQLAKYRRLLEKTVLCRERAEELDDPMLKNLIDEIELILLDLCNAEDENFDELLFHVKKQIKESHILLEINSIARDQI